MLKILQFLLRIGLALMAISVVAGVVSTVFGDTLLRPVGITVDPELLDDVLGAAPGAQADDVRIDIGSTDDVTVRIVMGLVDLSVVACAAAILVLLLRATTDAVAGRPFSRQNVTRVERIGWTVLMGVALSSFAGGFADFWAQDRLGSSSLSLEISFGPILVGIALYALAEIWQRGAELAEFEEQTV
jgi:hypothetical protein